MYITHTLEKISPCRKKKLKRFRLGEVTIRPSAAASRFVRPFVPEDTDRLRRDTLISQMYEMEVLSHRGTLW